MSSIALGDRSVESFETEKGEGPASFVLLCASDLRWRYAECVTAAGQHARMVDTIEALLGQCVQEPPLGILLDMNAMTRLGAMATAPLFELDIDWPILRCTLLPDGGANFMSVDPLHFGSLAEALVEIARGDQRWRREGRLRHSLRLRLGCRLKFRREDESAWIPANCVNIGVGGMFAVTYEPLAVGDRLDIQLLDLAPLPMELRGRVVRVRRWDDSPQLPGIAVQFELETVTADFKRLLASPDRIETLLQGCRRAELPPGALSEKTADDVR